MADMNPVPPPMPPGHYARQQVLPDEPLGTRPEEREPIASPMAAVEAMLRQPRRVMYQMRQPGSGWLILRIASYLSPLQRGGLLPAGRTPGLGRLACAPELPAGLVLHHYGGTRRGALRGGHGLLVGSLAGAILVVFIAFAGVVGNVRLLPLLRQVAGSRSVARNVLVAWLAGNLFLGSQLCWVMRPFIWDPGRPVAFVGREFMHGSFYETVFDALKRSLFS